MHHKRLAYGLLAAFVAMASAEDKSDVHQLTEKTFDDFVKANPLVLAECKFFCSPLFARRLHGSLEMATVAT
jgi:hypothetical protein